MLRPSLLLVWVVACLSAANTARASEPQRLSVAVIDQREAGRVAPAAVAQAVRDALLVPTELADADDRPASLGLLSVVITRRGATLQWTLPDGRGESRTRAARPDTLLSSIAAAVGEMALAFVATRSIAEGELVDPYMRLRPRPTASPWGPRSVTDDKARAEKPLKADLVDPFAPTPSRPARDTIDPWG